MNPKVSAIVLSYNHERFIYKALEAVFLQDYNDYEIIVRDDASTDLSAEIISDFIKTHDTPQENITIEFIKGKQNLGLIKSYNLALSKAKGEIIVVFAGDDISDISRITKTVNLLEKFKVDIVAVDAQVINEQEKVISESLYNRNGKDSYENIGEKKNNLRLINSDNFPSRFVSVGGYGYTYNRSLLDSFNGFIPEGVFFEDEFIAFLAIWNKGILFTYEPLVNYRRHKNNISDSLLISNKNLTSLLIYKQKECGLYENQIDYMRKIDKLNSSSVNKHYILMIEKMWVINKIHLNYLLKGGIFNNLFLFLKLVINKKVKVITKTKYLIYSVFPFLIKKELEREMQSRFDYFSFD